MDPLLTGAAIGPAVQSLFATPTDGRRVVITAYVGADPVPLLGNVQGVEVYCSPSPTGTSAVGVRRLLDAGATVYFSKHLHMKVYWVEGRGALVGSANLSDNGLAGGLAEVLVPLPDTVVPIDALIASFKEKPNKASAEAIDVLQKGNDACRRNSNIGESAYDPEPEAGDARGATVSFAEWDRWRREGLRTPIKLGWFCEKIDPPATLEEAAESGGFLDGVEDFNASRDADTYAKGDWVLLVRVKEGDHARTDREVRWLHVDGVKQLTKKEAGDAGLAKYRHAAWEGKLDPKRSPPFDLTPDTKKAIRKAWKELAPAWIKRGEVPESTLAAVPDAFFDAVQKHLSPSQDTADEE